MSDSLSSLSKQKQPWTNRSRRSLQKSNRERVNCCFAHKKRAICLKKFFLYHVFTSFLLLSPFLGPRANRSQCSLFGHSFLKSNGSDSLLSLFTKEWPWANCSCRSLQKSDREPIAPVALYKRATMSGLLPLLFTKEWRERFSRITIFLFCSQKTSNSLEKPESKFSTLVMCGQWTFIPSDRHGFHADIQFIFGTVCWAVKSELKKF